MIQNHPKNKTNKTITIILVEKNDKLLVLNMFLIGLNGFLSKINQRVCKKLFFFQSNLTGSNDGGLFFSNMLLLLNLILQSLKQGNQKRLSYNSFIYAFGGVKIIENINS
jgi:hypothetical protein